jgi:putative nucleotidyltransferase with HDIG domain
MPRLGKARVDRSPVGGSSWHARPLAAGLVRLTITVAPIVAAVAAGVTTTRIWDRPRGVGAQLGWLATSVGAAVVASYLLARAARRLLPLATLLKLSLAFPDRTPSRFAVALRAGTLSNLEARATRLTEAGSDVPMAHAAKEVILLAVTLTRHDRGTRGHSERVRALTDVLAEELRLSPADRDRLQWAGLLHDIGKVAVPTAILNKPGPLSDQEWEVMRRHPEEGARLLAPLAAWMGPWADVVPQHHERYNGTGYPRQLSGDEICLGARIVAVADTFEVMTSARSYKRPLPAAAAREEISAKAGDLFDPAVARALLNVSLGRLRWITGPIAWLLAWPVFDRVGAVTQALQPAVQSSLGAAAAGTLAAVVAMSPAAPASLATGPVPQPEAAAPSAQPASVAPAVVVDLAEAADVANAQQESVDRALAPPAPVPLQATPVASAPSTSPVVQTPATSTEEPSVDSVPPPEGPPHAALGTGTHQVSAELPDAVPSVPVALTVDAAPLPTALPDLEAPAPSAQ